MDKQKHIFEEYIVGTILLIMLVLGSSNVFLRYVFNSSIRYVDDLMTPLFVWLTMFGAPCTVYHKANMGLSLFVDMMPEVPRKVIGVFAFALGFLLFLYLGYNGTEMLVSQMKYGQTTLVPWIPAWFWCLCFPVCSLLYCIRAVQVLIRDFRHTRDRTEEDGGAEE